MKAVILAGGLGTRLSEETGVKPKPMVEIGERPILWHVMKIYSAHGINDFVICCGYKGHLIKEYFANYYLRMSDVTFDLAQNKMSFHQRDCEPWRVTLVDTGDVDISGLVRFHRNHGRQATLTAVQPPGRFGAFTLSGETPSIQSFTEKPQGDGAWINGGFFVLEPKVIDRIEGDDTVWEHGPLESLAQSGELMAFQHTGFWQPMDTLRDKKVLTDLWDSGRAPWKVWEDGAGKVQPFKRAV
jgi:glucose-1-phosphate cytidylyltransferase